MRWIFIWSGFFLWAVDGVAQSSTEAGTWVPQERLRGTHFICPSEFQLARRTGRRSCWVRFNLESGKFLCVSKTVWKRFLLIEPHEGRKGQALCQVWRGRWKTFSPSDNRVVFSEKSVFQSFYALDFISPFEGIEERRAQGSFFLQTFLSTRNGVERWREETARRVRASDSHGVVRRLLVGERMPGSHEGLFRDLGFVHLFSATGIHLYALARLTRSMVFQISQVFSIPLRAGIWISRISACLFWISAWTLEGLRAGMLRPWVVIWIRSWSRILGFRLSLFSPLWISLSIDIALALFFWIFMGEAGWSPGRLYYALAVGGGLMAMDCLPDRKYPHKLPGLRLSLLTLKEHLALSVGSWLTTATLDLFFYRLIAVANPILSVLTIPFFTFLIYPPFLMLSILALMTGDWSFFEWLGPLIWFANEGVSFLAFLSMKWKTLWVVEIQGFFLGGVLAALSLWFIFQKKETRFLWRVFAVVFGFSLLIFRLANMEMKLDRRKNIEEVWSVEAVQVEQLDVGQGDAALIQGDDGSVGLLDTGVRFALSNDAWIKLFAERGITRLDWVALSHLDEDHYGALFRLMNLLPISCVLTGEKGWKTARGEALKEVLTLNGIRAGEWDDPCFPYYGFEAGEVRRVKRAQESLGNEVNGVTVVFLKGGGSYVAMGDASTREEIFAWEEIQNRFPRKRLDPIYLKASHHGSRFSSSSEVLQAARPKEVWISAGLGNSYSHPTLKVLRRLEEEGIPVKRTDESGRILWRHQGWSFKAFQKE
jgi:beta-lactamase superfamily II metal-dependent hydrolase